MFVKNNHGTSLIGDVFTLYDGYNIQLRNPCTYEVDDRIIKVKSCGALLCVLLVCVYSLLSKICSEISF